MHIYCSCDSLCSLLKLLAWPSIYWDEGKTKLSLPSLRFNTFATLYPVTQFSNLPPKMEKWFYIPSGEAQFSPYNCFRESQRRETSTNNLPLIKDLGYV